MVEGPEQSGNVGKGKSIVDSASWGVHARRAIVLGDLGRMGSPPLSKLDFQSRHDPRRPASGYTDASEGLGGPI